MPWNEMLAFSVNTLHMRPKDFWKLTFAEYWPLYNSQTRHIPRPLSKLDIEELEYDWVKKINGNA